MHTDIFSKSSHVIGSFGMPDLPRWMMLDIISMTSATNICGWGGGGEREGDGKVGIGLYVETGQI